MNALNKQHGFGWVAWLMFIAIIGILMAIAIPCGDVNYIIRSKVNEGVVLASSAKVAIIENAANGMPFAAGWVAPNVTANVSNKPNPTEADRQTNAYTGISINPVNGIITITYTDEVDQGSPTLLLIPVTGKDYDQLLVKGKATIGEIRWLCHSKTAPNDNNFRHLLGTINSKFVPSNCRN